MAHKQKSKQGVQNKGITRRDFSYVNKSALGTDVSLAFTLRVDLKSELIAFQELLETALAEVSAEIAK